MNCGFCHQRILSTGTGQQPYGPMHIQCFHKVLLLSREWSPMRHHEYHITVTGDPIKWHQFCTSIGIKPLYIELNTFERQLMCAAPFNPCELIMRAGFPISRIKHEVNAPVFDERPVYWECHLKFDGPFMAGFPMASRDLYRPRRWYATRRETAPFNPGEFINATRPSLNVLAGFEYEAALIDTNPDLDARWVRGTIDGR